MKRSLLAPPPLMVLLFVILLPGAFLLPSSFIARADPLNGGGGGVESGRAVFAARCAGCHGEGALGSETGPPLVDRVYHPSHHGDFSFHLAVRNGVRAHHWRFGDMPPVEGLSPEDVEAIIEYVRGLQKEAGIF